MAIEHKYAVGSVVEARNPHPPSDWKPARVVRHAPYRGRPGYDLAFLDATEQWHCHSGWQSEATIRGVLQSGGGNDR